VGQSAKNFNEKAFMAASDTAHGSETPVEGAGRTGPLSHIRVLDLSRILAGPLAAQHLADMGADVIKVERTGPGDDTRGWGPPFVAEPTDDDPGLSAYFMCANRGKRSVSIDLTSERGADLVRKLAAQADVLNENFKVGGLKQYGLEYESVRATNPSIVYASITGFGQTGPYANRAGYDFLVQGMGGIMSVTGEPDERGGGPVKVGVAISDQMSGMNALAGILAALVRRERTGEGEHIDVALLDSTIGSLVNQAASYVGTDTVPGRMGNAHPTVVPYEVFKTADGHIILAAGNDGQFARFCAVAGLEHLAADPRYKTNAQRIINRGELIPMVADAMSRRTSDEWIAVLETANVPCGPINTIDRVFADPHVQARANRRTLPEPLVGSVDVVANPIRMASHDTTAPTAPPRRGAHTSEVLQETLGLSEAEIQELLTSGVAQQGPGNG
jgi:crotonobetainyl-CoA:carnitine CoA-transferase CaiB-like acyl-CoA transferase